MELLLLWYSHIVYLSVFTRYSTQTYNELHVKNMKREVIWNGIRVLFLVDKSRKHQDYILNGPSFLHMSQLLANNVLTKKFVE